MLRAQLVACPLAILPLAAVLTPANERPLEREDAEVGIGQVRRGL